MVAVAVACPLQARAGRGGRRWFLASGRRCAARSQNSTGTQHIDFAIAQWFERSWFPVRSIAARQQFSGTRPSPVIHAESGPPSP
jgi:hypothetical protein